MLSKTFVTFSIVGVLLLTSCSTITTDQEIDYKNGVRHGWVIEYYTPDSLAANLPECLTATSSTDLASKHFVRVRYRQGGSTFSTIAEWPDKFRPKPNTQVEFWPRDCSNGKIGRIKRIIPSAS